MFEYSGQERRKSYRKEYSLPIKLIPRKKVSLIGNISNINCYGLKVEIRFKNTGPSLMLDAIFCAPKITLEFANGENKINFEFPAQTKWKASRSDAEDKIYDVGFVLNIEEKQKLKWCGFYNSLKN